MTDLSLLPSVRQALARATIDVRSLAGGDGYRKFVVVGTARTGSTLLLNLLNSNSRILAFGEIFRSPESVGWDVAPFTDWQSKRLLKLYREDPLAFLHRRVFRRWPRATAAAGFKIFYYHAREKPFSAIWDYLSDSLDIHVLHIKRQNILEQYLSLRRAHMTDIWSSVQSSHTPSEPISLDPEACRKHFREVRAFEAECDSFFTRHPVLPVVYEDLVADRTAQMQKIQHFLGVDSEPVSAQIKRQRTEPICHSIRNYDELKAVFSGTEWESFFREQNGGQ